MNSNYKPMANVTIEKIRQGPSINERYGHIPLVTSSVNLIFLFMKRQFFFFSSRNKNKFGPIVSWAEENWKQIESIRDNLLDDFEEMTFDYPTSYSCKYFGCTIKNSEEGEKFVQSKWYRERFNAPREIREENTMTLKEARLNHLLDQLCFRLNNAYYQISKNENSEYDINFKKNLERFSKNVNEILNEFIRVSNRKPVENNNRKIVKKQNVVKQMEQEEIVPNEQTPDITLENITNNF
jgi:hypothetical protein